MSTAQDPARRLKQKRRRTTQLEAWRAKQPVEAPAAAVAAAPAAKAKAPAKA